MASRITTGVVLAWLAVAGVTAQQTAPKVASTDTLKITVANADPMNGSFTVDALGEVDVPMVGRLKVAGLTTREIGELIGRQVVDKGFMMVAPQVMVDLTQAENQRVTVTGAVRSPQELRFAGSLKLFDALVRVGMTGPAAGDQVLVVRPGTDDNPDGEVLTVNLRELTGGNLAEQDIELRDGDRVIVPEAEKVFIDGYVRSPGAVQVPPDATVRQALALVGGITPQGSDRGIRILRRKDGASEPEEIKDVKLTDPVLPGDTIIIRKRIL